MLNPGYFLQPSDGFEYSQRVKQFIAIAQVMRDDELDCNISGGGARRMSQQALEAVIGRAILDGEFRLALFADPETALVGYELTEVEVAALKRVDAESLDACSGGLARHILNMLIRSAPDVGHK